MTTSQAAAHGSWLVRCSLTLRDLAEAIHKLNIATLIIMRLVANAINFFIKISLENYATTQLGQKKSNILTFTLSPG